MAHSATHPPIPARRRILCLPFSMKPCAAKAWRWLGLLVHDAILQETEKGEPGKGRTSRYHYLEATP